MVEITTGATTLPHRVLLEAEAIREAKAFQGHREINLQQTGKRKYMKQIFIFCIILLSGRQVFSQVPEDAKLYSWYPQTGTARSLAIGGAMGSLGGDISALYVNPAGLGFYRTNEFVISPQFSFNKNAATFINNPKDTGKNAFALGAIGVIFGEGSNKKGKKSSAFSIGITQTANFNNRVYYKGINDYSSFSETFAEEFAKSGISTDELLNTLSPLPYTAAPAYYTYLIDIDTSNGISQVRAAPEQLLDAGGSLQQSFLKETQGGLYELALGGAINTNDKWLFGGTLGIPIVDFTSTTTVTEKDASGNTKNGFQSFSYEDEYRTTGVGFNVKLGAIYRPAEYFRLGLALHTASFIFLKDERTANLNTILEDTAGNAENFSVSSLLFTNNEAGEANYRQFTPWKAIFSASYVFREIENVKKQRGFLTADVEYVNYKGSRFGKSGSKNTGSKQYYSALNDVIKDYYKGAFNFRVGGELKFNTFMTRLGFAYYGNPYADKTYKASRTLLSGGIGYRNKGFFADLTYIHSITKDVNYPYRLEDRSNPYYATQRQKSGMIAATIGWKFWE